MRHLAQEPVGTKSALGTTELAHLLTQLPRRAAWVRSGDELATIYTHPIPKSLTGVELRERLEVIMTQTREKYCRPKTEVESGFFKTPEKTTPDAPAETARISRWEEVE